MREKSKVGEGRERRKCNAREKRICRRLTLDVSSRDNFLVMLFLLVLSVQDRLGVMLNVVN